MPKRAIKQLALYGRTTIWKTRKDGVRQRYWTSTRFEFKGTGSNLRKAFTLALDKKYVPKMRYVKVGAAAFMRSPNRYARRVSDHEWKRPVGRTPHTRGRT